MAERFAGPAAAGCMALVAAWLLGLAVPAALAADDSLEGDRAKAAAGDPQALLRLAERYETADGVPFDLGAARTLLELAAERGDAAGAVSAGSANRPAGWLRMPISPKPTAGCGWPRSCARMRRSGCSLGAMSEALAERLDMERSSGPTSRSPRSPRPPAQPTSRRSRAAHARTSDPAALLALLPTTGCGSPEVQRREDGEPWCSWPMRRAGPTVNRDHTRPPHRSRAARRRARCRRAEPGHLHDPRRRRHIRNRATGLRVSLAGIPDDGPAPGCAMATSW